MIFPSERKRERLKEQGVLPISGVATSAASALGLLFGLFFVYGKREEIASLLKLPDIEGEQGGVLTGIDNEFFLMLCSLLCIPVLIAVFCALIVHLLQSRFFFRPALLSFSMSRINPFQLPSVSHLFGRPLRGVGVFIFAMLFAVSLFLYTFDEWISIFNGDPETTGLLFQQLFQGTSILIGIVLFFLIPITWAAGRLIFNIAHRMTEEELREELRSEE